MELNDIKKHLLVNNLKESEIVALLREQNAAFTSNRERIGEYVLSPERVSAYTCFYLPTNIPKLDFLLDQLPSELYERLKRANLIDYGCGPGTYSVGWLSHFGTGESSFKLVDSSKLMLEQADKLIKGLFPRVTDCESLSRYSSKAPDNTALLFGHSLNEIGFESGVEIIRNISPEFLIVIEPGTPAVFEWIPKLRTEMAALGYKVAYPCACLDSECPMEKREGDWCHGVLRTTHSQDVERLSQLIARDRRNMPMIAHVYYKGDMTDTTSFATTVQFLQESKFSFVYSACVPIDGKLEIMKFEILKKGMSKAQIKEMKKSSVGERVNFELVKKISESHIRVKLV